jgi:hypothetical protein
VPIPFVEIPLSAVVDRYTTLVAGRYAQAVFRNEARVIELALDLSKKRCGDALKRHPGI